MADFTNISPYRRGEPRFGRDPEDEPANGPVVTYRLSPEEIAAKYGPPVKEPGRVRQRRLNRDVLSDLLKKYTPGQIAAMYSCPKHLILKMVERYGIELDEKNRKEDEQVETVNETAETAQPAETVEVERTDSTEPQGYVVYERRKTRLEIAREKLTKEQYLELIKDGATDHQVRTQYGIPGDVMTALKKEWGLIPPRQPRKNARKAELPGQPEPAHVPTAENAPQSDRNGPNSGEKEPGNMVTPEPSYPQATGDLNASSEYLTNYATELCMRMNLDELSSRLDATVRLLNELGDRLENLEHEYSHHRHQVGPGHWSGKAEV